MSQTVDILKIEDVGHTGRTIAMAVTDNQICQASLIVCQCQGSSLDEPGPADEARGAGDPPEFSLRPSAWVVAVREPRRQVAGPEFAVDGVDCARVKTIGERN